MFNSFYKLALREAILSYFYKGVLAYWPWVDIWIPKTNQKNTFRTVVWKGELPPPQQNQGHLTDWDSPNFLTAPFNSVSPQPFPNSIWLLCCWLSVTPTLTPTLSWRKGGWAFGHFHVCFGEGRWSAFSVIISVSCITEEVRLDYHKTSLVLHTYYKILSMHS